MSAAADAVSAPGASEHGPLPPLLLLLTAVTGVVDAVSILRLGRVFVANMPAARPAGRARHRECR